MSRVSLGAPTSRVSAVGTRRGGAARTPGASCVSVRAAAVGGDGEYVVTIVGGAGRVGSAFAAVALDSDASVRVVRRGDDDDDAFGEHTRGPIFVATRVSDLDRVIKCVPASRVCDLIFTQGGLLRDKWLTERGLENTTQAALFLSAVFGGNMNESQSGNGDMHESQLVDGGGMTVAIGRRAKDVVDLLRDANVRAKSVDAETFKKAALVKLIWTSAFWLLCDVYGKELGGVGSVTVGDLVDEHDGKMHARTEALCGELFDVAIESDEFGFLCDRKDAIVSDVLRYSRHIPTAVPSREMAISEMGFRNHWFLRENASRKKYSSSLHRALLREAGVET
jgi:hypothetical protein